MKGRYLDIREFGYFDTGLIGVMEKGMASWLQDNSRNPTISFYPFPSISFYPFPFYFEYYRLPLSKRIPHTRFRYYHLAFG